MRKLIIATTNLGKIKEFKTLFKDKFEILSLRDINYPYEIIEDGKSFKENALIKAKTISLYTNEIVISDDSGLEVFALDNEPGIYSARYAGDMHDDDLNNQLLIKNLRDVFDKSARYVCAMCIYFPNNKYEIFEDYAYGQIILEPLGENGFGYDPYFYVKELDKTFAQITLEEKNNLSHRAKATRSLIKYIDENIDNK